MLVSDLDTDDQKTLHFALEIQEKTTNQTKCRTSSLSPSQDSPSSVASPSAILPPTQTGPIHSSGPAISSDAEQGGSRSQAKVTDSETRKVAAVQTTPCVTDSSVRSYVASVGPFPKQAQRGRCLLETQVCGARVKRVDQVLGMEPGEGPIEVEGLRKVGEEEVLRRRRQA